MYKKIGGGVKSCCILIVILLCTALSQDISEGVNSHISIYHGLKDEFKGEIPKPFEKIGEKYYNIDQNNTVNWFGAAENCRQIGGNLVNLQNKLELENIKVKLNSSFIYWTDLNNLAKKTVFYSLTTGSYSNFLNVENDELDMCGILKYEKNTREFTVGQQKCMKKGRPICESKLPTTISVSLW
ncbi:accessory gland protein Acp29AB-like [Drosophila innubila]|uniref:accessory gland protein Acp29AB-like n=1 Tax=Drosophila innubila TaxID=198719 RepID=UPI00148C4E52|nr:accessory gland protein Acp29AB-like [Drosophila innubila]